MKPIKCKICGGEHAGTLCTKFAKAKGVPSPAVKRIQAVAARPVKMGSKGKAKKAKQARK